MPTIEDHLTRIKHKMDRGEREAPRRELEDLIAQMSVDEFTTVWRADIMKLVNQFQPKKHRDLMEVIDNKINGAAWIGSIDKKASKIKEAATAYAVATDPDLTAEFRNALDELGEQHIFQWSTFYRDCLAKYLVRFLDELKHLSPDDPCDALSAPLAEHAQDIFPKGYSYVRRDHDHDYAIKKSINGLSRFLALPLDYYSARWSSISDRQSAVALRLVVSASVSGIIRGYSAVSFGGKAGDTVLPRFPRSWMHYMAFLTPRHAEYVIDRLESGALSEGLRTSVLPLLDAFQEFFQRQEDYFPIPVAGQYAWSQRRLDVTIRPPSDAVSQRFMEARAFLDEGFVSIADLDDAAGRQVALVVAPLQPDVRKIVNERKRLQTMVVPADEVRASVADQAFRVWGKAVFATRSRLKQASPITYNFAREFPLHDPNRAKFFHVDRTSVRDLLRTFERRNGVRLWCSVRRSGKTTACLDLESTTGDSIIVSQTCGVAQSEDERKFYDRVDEATDSDRRVSSTFVRDVVAECAPIDLDDRRVVLVIDEYETLFGLLESAAQERPRIRYAVVQPILNQLRLFSNENLLVFLGQQPDAHFILMDQNQLAPYVEQDPFPLFEHAPGAKTGEFAELVDKILWERIEGTASFLKALFRETAGHPYLTANVLVEFVEWLIEAKRPLGLRVDSADFTEFVKQRLSASRIMLSPDYDFFRNASAKALSERGYKNNPWLFTAYWTLRLLSSEKSYALRVRRKEFPDLMTRIPVPSGGLLPDCSEILRSASLANFLSYDDEWVKVKIQTLGRIAAAVRPEVA